MLALSADLLRDHRRMAEATAAPTRYPARLGILVLLGAVLGLLGARYVLVGSGWSLLPWGVAAVVIGVLAGTWRQAAIDAGVYGFALVFVFMLSGYSGAGPAATRLPFFALLGLVGAVCAALLAVAAKAMRGWSRREHW